MVIVIIRTFVADAKHKVTVVLMSATQGSTITINNTITGVSNSCPDGDNKHCRNVDINKLKFVLYF